MKHIFFTFVTSGEHSHKLIYSQEDVSHFLGKGLYQHIKEKADARFNAEDNGLFVGVVETHDGKEISTRFHTLNELDETPELIIKDLDPVESQKLQESLLSFFGVKGDGLAIWI